MSFSIDDKIKVLRREIAFRRNVYRKRVSAGLMTQAEADHEIAVMEAILDDYAGEGL